jgi:hypothetical protein
MAVSLSALRAGRTFARRKIPGTHFCYRLSRPQGYNALLEGLSQLKKSNDFIVNRTRDLPACSIVPQPTTLPRAPVIRYLEKQLIQSAIIYIFKQYC